MFTTYAIRRNLFDEIADSAFGNHNTIGLMNTDIRETDQGFEMAVDLPGVQKENLSAELKDGYLNISATINRTEEAENSKGRYLRRERFVGSMRRTFYVGDKVTQEDIHARFQDGVLCIFIPKKQQPVLEQKNLIAIED
ncbi:MAG: Hsp20/alpha crystallin family protein [Candidatus Faecousia sp.]|nr:Hsp20/alpha crystallin family protein [Candidatus Faecousia sp.]